MSIKAWLKTFWEDYKAWKRGERRVGARGSRGRVYERKEGYQPAPNAGSTTRSRSVTLTARVFRKNGGPVEYYDLNSKKEMTNG